jgi:hypothetical protein
MTAIARPRRCGPTATAASTGVSAVITAAAAPWAIRAPSSSPKEGATAQPRLATANPVTAASSAGRWPTPSSQRPAGRTTAAMASA